MKVFLGIILLFLLLAGPKAGAQDVAQVIPETPILTPPISEPSNPDGSRCFTLYNQAPYTVAGSMITNYFEVADGTKSRQRLNFRMAPKENHRYCTYGPFYPGERLELVLRTLVPIFSCYTAAQGDIVIKGIMKPEGGTKTWVDCQ